MILIEEAENHEDPVLKRVHKVQSAFHNIIYELTHETTNFFQGFVSIGTDFYNLDMLKDPLDETRKPISVTLHAKRIPPEVTIKKAYDTIAKYIDTLDFDKLTEAKVTAVRDAIGEVRIEIQIEVEIDRNPPF